MFQESACKMNVGKTYPKIILRKPKQIFYALLKGVIALIHTTTPIKFFCSTTFPTL